MGVLTGQNLFACRCNLQGELYASMLERFTKREDANFNSRMDAALRLSRYYMDQGKFDIARYYVDNYDGLAKKHKISQVSAVIPYYYFRLDSLSGHTLNALQFFQRYKKASDSNLNVTRRSIRRTSAWNGS